MDAFLQKQLQCNSLNFKMSLDRIAEKYSKPQYQDGGIEVDINNTNYRTLAGYMQQSRTAMKRLESQSLTDESLRSQDITRDSQLDFTHEDVEADESCVSSVSSTQFSLEDPGMASSHMTQLTVSSLDESRRSLSETELLPEDLDEELEMSLRSHGSSLVDLYPSMISRIGKAWHRQHVSDAADSVLKRYRRWRQKPNRSHLNNTFIVPQRQGNPNKSSKMLLKETLNSPVKIQYLETDATPWSPLKIMTNAQDWQAHHQSPKRVRDSQHQPVLVMDFSDSSETYKPKDLSLNETFDVSEQPSTYPSRPFYPTAKASLDLSLRSKRLSLAAPSPQTDVCSVYASQERPDIYSSPVRQSPLKARVIAGLIRSPHALSRSPRAQSVESVSRVPSRRRSLSTSLSSPHKPTVQLRMLNAQDSHHSLQSQLPSPQSATAAGERHRLRRHLSFDSSILQSTQVSSSPKKIDKDFVKLYHKFVCQNKSSPFNGAPCRYCARSSEANRGHSSSALAALALSPHRSLLRKRHRVMSWDCHPQSKRPRDEYSSPGSKRHQMLRCRLSSSDNELSHDCFSYSPSKHSMFQRYSSQQRSADAHQETWMSRGRDLSAAECSSLGGSLESNMTYSHSPRKWW
ncbi:uncharacterized protein [Pagrus major]|uniref:uncharacterized protein n=1 Tax=Pagrus major TaxID=143350 RepID=UPI003CC894FC